MNPFFASEGVLAMLAVVGHSGTSEPLGEPIHDWDKWRWIIVIGMGVILVACGGGRDDLAKLRERGYAFSVDEFHRAAGEGEEVVVREFLGAGMAVDVRDGRGFSALEHAARAGRAEVVAELARFGARIDPEDEGVRSAVMWAAGVGSAETVEELLRQGADLRRRDEDGWHALLIAAFEGHGGVVEVIVPHVSGQDIDDALLMAALHGDVKMSDLLLRGGASVLARDAMGRTPLMLAARYGHVDTVRLLMENGANRFSLDPGTELTAAQMAQIALVEAREEGDGEFELRAAEIVELLSAPPRPDEVAGNIEDPRELIAIDEGFVPSAYSERYLSDRDARYGLRLAGATVETVYSGFDGMEEAMVFTEYRESPIPVRVVSVGEEHAVVRKLFGDHERVRVEVGDPLPGTEYVVTELQRRMDHTRLEGGEPLDVSVVVAAVSRPMQHSVVQLVRGEPARRNEPYAVVRVGTDLYKAIVGDEFRISRDGETLYRVMDVRPTQLIIENVLTGGTHTLRRAGRNGE